MTNNPGYQLIVFDWEGTLSDTPGQIFELIRQQAKHLNFPQPDWQVLRDSIHYGPIVSLKKLYPDITEMELQAFLAAIQTGLAKSNEQVFLLPGAFELIQKLKKRGYDLAIASNKGEQSLAKAIQLAGLGHYFPVFRSASQTQPKPHPEMLAQILTVFQCPPERCLMIGDSESDIEMAQQLNIDAIGLDMYHQKENSLLRSGALSVVDNFEALTKMIVSKE